jgi:antirestriction protein
MSPRLYVGTYAKYNSGSIAGAWLDLDDFSDRDAFYKQCAELHSDESDPEFMFQDFEGFPRALYCESSASEALFDWLALDESDRELLGIYQDSVDQAGTIEDARDAYRGTYSSREAWAEEYLESGGLLAEVPEALRNYIDFEAYARDADCNGMHFVRVEGDVWVFG